MLNHAKIPRWLRRQARYPSLSAPKPAAKNNRRKHPDKLRGDEGHDAWAMQIARHRGMKKAIVALARRLAVIMHRIWVDGTEFRWTRDVAAA